MTWRLACVVICGMLAVDAAAQQAAMRYKLAMVALTEDPQVRINLEDGLAAKFRANDYDAVTSHDIVPDVTDLDNADIVSGGCRQPACGPSS